MLTPEEQYFLDTYGTCKLESCTCLRSGWRGTFCPNWQPLGVKSQKELLEYALKKYEISLDKSNKDDKLDL